MAKFKHIFLALVLILFAAGCSANDDEGKKEQQNNEAKTEEKEDESALEVEKGLFNVEVTVPASLLEGEDLDEVITEAKESGIKDVRKNEDGSLTYKMSKSKHKELMKELESTILETLEEIETDDDFPSIKKIEHGKSFTEFSLTVDKDAYENSLDIFAIIGIAFQGMYYQVFDGVKPEKLQVTFTIKDESGTIFDTIVFPDDSEEEGQ